MNNQRLLEALVSKARMLLYEAKGVAAASGDLKALAALTDVTLKLDDEVLRTPR